MNWILQGLLVGFAFAILIGPIFFVYIQTSVKKGFKFGIMVGVGVWLADLLLITIMNLSLRIVQDFVQQNQFKFWFSLISGAILLILGIIIFLTKTKTGNEVAEDFLKKKKLEFPRLLAKGFLINFINPFVILYWLGLTISLSIKQQPDISQKFLFFGGAMFSRTGIDLCKIYLGKHVKNWLNPSKAALFQRVVGLIIFSFGIAMMAKAFNY